MSRLVNTVYSASAAAERIIELLDERPSVVESSSGAARPGAGRDRLRRRHLPLSRDRAERRLERSRSRSSRARCWRWSARAARASPRWPSCCCASTTRTSGGPARRPGPRELRLPIAARQHGAAAAGDARLRRHRPREHRLRPARRHAGADRGGGAAADAARFHLLARRRLRHRDRPEGAAAFGRAAPADRDREGDDPRRARTVLDEPTTGLDAESGSGSSSRSAA